MLLVGDQAQLPPFTKWRGAHAAGYSTSLMARLATTRGGGGGGGPPSFMLTEQYRMHPAICELISSAFYRGKLRTAPPTAAARAHPLPAAFVDVAGAREAAQGSSFLNVPEAEAVVRLARLCVDHAGFAPGQLVVRATARDLARPRTRGSALRSLA